MRVPVTLPTTARNRSWRSCRARSSPECLPRADRMPGQLQCAFLVDLVTLRDDGTGRPRSADSVTCCSCCTSAASTASAPATFCVRRRCLAGGTPEVPRCVPEVDRVTCCGCSTCGQDWSVYGLTMKAYVTRLSIPLTKLEASSGLVFYRPGFPNGAFRRGHYSTGNSACSTTISRFDLPFFGRSIVARLYPGSRNNLNAKLDRKS